MCPWRRVSRSGSRPFSDSKTRSTTSLRLAGAFQGVRLTEALIAQDLAGGVPLRVACHIAHFVDDQYSQSWPFPYNLFPDH
jgi:hypothetical protein